MEVKPMLRFWGPSAQLSPQEAVTETAENTAISAAIW
jgi:hypothetical protein